MRVGHGYDVHAFGAGDHVTLGGVVIPHRHGLVAHSDGDVALHALCDALLGAAGAGDIGRHFPDSDPAYAGIDSRQLLQAVVTRLADRGWAPVNVDLTLVAQAPRLGAHIPAMVEGIAECLGIPTEAVNVKATTTERLGPIGREEGIAAHAVALITPRD